MEICRFERPIIEHISLSPFYVTKKAKAPQIYLLCGAFAIKIEIII
jgi:hypothetical protein